MGASQIGLAVPNFWFGDPAGASSSRSRCGSAPAGGFPGWGDPARAIGALILPAIALASVQAAMLTRVTRSALIEALSEDFMRTARAKGVARRAALWRHALPNALVPILTMMGLQFANVIAGAIVVENVFVLPGLGRLMLAVDREPRHAGGRERRDAAGRDRDRPEFRRRSSAARRSIRACGRRRREQRNPSHPSGERQPDARRRCSPARWRLWRSCRSSGRPIRRPRSTFRTSSPRPPSRIGSAPTLSAATSPRG